MTIVARRKPDSSDVSSRSASILALGKMPVDESTTLDGTYRIESILDCVSTIRRSNEEPSVQNMIIQMLLD